MFTLAAFAFKRWELMTGTYADETIDQARERLPKKRIREAQVDPVRTYCFDHQRPD